MLLPIVMLAAQPGQTATCPAVASVPAGLDGWRQTASRPSIGQAFVVQGADPTDVRGLTETDISHAGQAALVPVEINVGGTYRVAVSDPAWVDMLSGGKALPPAGHAHGPRCSGIAKIVDYRLTPGRYALHISGLRTASVRVLIARA